MFDAPFGIWVVLGPEAHEFVQVVRTKDGPIPGEVVKVVHDDGNEQVEDEKGADDEEGDEVREGEVGAAAGRIVRVLRRGIALDI